jgi:hypothetical protein
MAEDRLARLLNQAHKCGVDVPGLQDALADYMWADSDDEGENFMQTLSYS